MERDLVEIYSSWFGRPSLAPSYGHCLRQSAGADNLARREGWIDRIMSQEFNQVTH